MCTKGKNEVTELKCASFLPMDHIVRVLTSRECIVEAKVSTLMELRQRETMFSQLTGRQFFVPGDLRGSAAPPPPFPLHIGLI